MNILQIGSMPYAGVGAKNLSAKNVYLHNQADSVNFTANFNSKQLISSSKAKDLVTVIKEALDEVGAKVTRHFDGNTIRLNNQGCFAYDGTLNTEGWRAFDKANKELNIFHHSSLGQYFDALVKDMKQEIERNGKVLKRYETFI